MGPVDDITSLRNAISSRLDEAKISVDQSLAEGGISWVDVELRGQIATVEVRPGEGYGVSRPDGAYGEGPDIVVKHPSEAAQYLAEFLQTKTEPSAISSEMVWQNVLADERFRKQVFLIFSRIVERAVHERLGKVVTNLDRVSKDLRKLESRVSGARVSPPATRRKKLKVRRKTERKSGTERKRPPAD